MKITVVVENDQTQSLSIDQGGDPIVVAPGQNATIEVLASHPVTISVPEGVASDPATPAAPVVSDNAGNVTTGAAVDTSGQTLHAETQPTTGTLTQQANLGGDTGALVIPRNSPPELFAVAQALESTNGAIAQANVATADAAQAQADLDSAQADLDAAQTDGDKGAAQTAVNDASARLTAAGTAASPDIAQSHADAAADAAATVQKLADDPDHPMTQDHADLAAGLADNAAQAVKDMTDGAGASADDADAEKPIVAATEDAEVQPPAAQTDGDKGAADTGAAAAPATTDAVVTIATDGTSSILTQAPDGTTLATPVTGIITPGSVLVDSDGTPLIQGDDAPTLGTTAPAPIGTPTPADAGGMSVGALTADDGSTPAPTDLGDPTGAIPISDDHAAAASAAPPPSNATVIALIQHLADTDEALTDQGEISIDHLNAALVANGFSPITTDHPALAEA